MTNEELALADQRALAERLLGFADRCDGISERLLAEGLTLPSQVYRRAVEACARTPQELDELHTVWRESRRERLAALRGPMDLRRGLFPFWAGYRSAFLDGARQAAAALEDGTHTPVALCACERRFDEAALTMPLPDPLFVAANAARADAARRLMQAHAVQPGEPGVERLHAVYSAILDRPEVAHKAVSTKLAAYSIPFGGGRWRLSLVDESAQTLADGLLEVSFAITFNMAKVNRTGLTDGKLAGFSIDHLIPWGSVSCRFDPDDFAQFYLAAVTVATLARLTFDDFLSN